MRPRLIILVLLLSVHQLLFAAVAVVTESFSLQFRPAEDIIPLVKPYLHQEGVITGSGYKLIIKTTGSNLTQLKEIISELDIELKRLRVSVSTDRKSVEEAMSKQATISDDVATGDSPNVQKIILSTGSQHKVTTKVFSTASRQNHFKTQNVQVQEGQWAVINTGSAVPYTERRQNADGTVTEVVHYQKRSSGFRLRAHTNGNKVYLTIHPKIERQADTEGGATTYQELETTITTELNRWVDLGGTEVKQVPSETGKTFSTQRSHELIQGIYLKVELVN
ncbi:MAG: type II and III secretion system protein [Gammaproteobacteria bacterium]|nr:type II and III secretion system protein [Gammaproteobacteria bacterium]